MRKRIVQIVLVVGIGVVAVVSWKVGRDLYWRKHPDAAFTSITGRVLPPGVRATAYAHEINDNLFHTTHYWLLAGAPSELHKVIVGTEFERSDEDARNMLPNLRDLFGVDWSREEVAAGYEWEVGRDRWYYIFAGEDRALYVQ
jgi:hypothetical protein